MRRYLRSLGWTLALLACALSLGGCRWFFRGARGGSGSPDDDVYAASGNLVVENGFQSGSMGNVDGYSGTAFRQEGYSYPGYSNVRLDSSGSGWWVMSSLSVSGATLDELVPGVTYRSGTSGVIEDDGVDLDMLGCSGPEVGNWDYDTHAEQVEVEVEDLGGGQRRVFWRAWFRHGESTQLVEGQFDYRTVR